MSTGRLKTAGDSVFTGRTVTPSDSADITLGGVSRDAGAHPTAIMVEDFGAVALTDLHGENITYAALAIGVWHRIAYRRVRATGTTATAIKAGWTG